jgi:hypothetical protein
MDNTNNVQNPETVVENVVKNAPETAANEAPAAPETAAPAIIKNHVKATVTAVSLAQFDGQNYKTLGLRLNKSLKWMKQNDAGLYEETATPFLNIPLSAALSQITDDVMNYYLAVKGAEVENLKTALSGAEIDVDQRLFTAGETIDDVANETDHDQWFSFIKSVKVSKMATLVMTKQLGLSIDELKLLLD